MLNVIPHADLVVGIRRPDLRVRNAVVERAREMWLGRLPGARNHHRWFLPLEALAFASLDTRKYDLIISSSHAFAKAVRPRRGAAHLCYCHSPPRYLWDLRDAYWRDATVPQRAAFAFGVAPLRRIDRWSAGGVTRFAANSSYVADRIRRWYGRNATVIYPPVEMKRGSTSSGRRDDFLLSLGRLVPYKRVDLAIRAAERMGVRLIVAGDGPDRPRLERLAGPMTTFVGTVSDDEAAHLLDRCRAFVFCADEDFGIAPLEANAHGAPVVGLARGGLLETMVPGRTAEFFDDEDVGAVIAAIGRALERDWAADQLRKNAERFAPSEFRARFRAWVQSALSCESNILQGAEVG